MYTFPQPLLFYFLKEETGTRRGKQSNKRTHPPLPCLFFICAIARQSWVFGDFRPFGDYRPLPRLFAHNYGGDLRRSAGFVEEGPCSGAKRSEAKRSGAEWGFWSESRWAPSRSPRSRDGTCSFGTCRYKGYLASDERKHRRTAAEAYNIFILQNDEDNLLAFLAGCEHDARVMYHQATVFGVCTIYASGCEHDSRIMYHQASVDVCTIYASWHRFQSRRVSPGDSGWRLGAAREELQTRWPLLT